MTMSTKSILNEEEIFFNNIIREFKMRVLDYDAKSEDFK